MIVCVGVCRDVSVTPGFVNKVLEEHSQVHCFDVYHCFYPIMAVKYL